MSVTTVLATNGSTPYQVTLKVDAKHEWRSDEPVEVGGGDTGPSPTQLLLSSLGACTAITLRMYAARKEWPLIGVEVALQLNPAGKPATGHNDIQRTISLQGELSNAQRERLLQIANACPIHKVLSGEIQIQSSLTD